MVKSTVSPEGLFVGAEFAKFNLIVDLGKSSVIISKTKFQIVVEGIIETNLALT